MNTKRCRVCGEEKPTNQFHKDNSRKDGLKNICIQCAASQRVEKRRDKIRANMMDDRRFSSVYSNQDLHKLVDAAARRYAKRSNERQSILAQEAWLSIAENNSTDTGDCAKTAHQAIERVYRNNYNHRRHPDSPIVETPILLDLPE